MSIIQQVRGISIILGVACCAAPAGVQHACAYFDTYVGCLGI